MLIFVVALIALALVSGAVLRALRRGAATPPPEAASPLVMAAPVAVAVREAGGVSVDAGAAASASAQLTRRLWRTAFPVPADAPPEGADEAAVRGAVFALLRAEQLDPKYFPRRPALMPQLLQAFDDPTTAVERISRMIAHDPVLSADVLRLANSSLYRKGPTPVETIQRAVIVCGMHELRGLVMTAMLQPVFRATRTNFPRFPRLLWERTERAALAAELYAARCSPADRFEAQLVALMAALGPLAVYGATLDVYARTPQLTPDPALCMALIADLGPPMALRIAKQWEAAPRALAALRAAPEEPLTAALHIGELLGTLSLLVTQGTIGVAEGLELTRRLGVPDELAESIGQRLA